MNGHRLQMQKAAAPRKVMLRLGSRRLLNESPIQYKSNETVHYHIMCSLIKAHRGRPNRPHPLRPS